MLLFDSTVSGNSAELEGGGIDNLGHLFLYDSTVSGNSANFGGGISNYGSLNLITGIISGNSAEFGGGIANVGNLSVTESTVSGNRAEFGGGILNNKNLTLTSSTVSGNSAGNDGGGISISQGPYGDVSTATLSNSTISNNAADSDQETTGNGGGTYVNDESTADIRSTIIAGNRDLSRSEKHPDISGTVEANANNLIGNTTGAEGFGNSDLTNINPRLGPLADNGGLTQTHALLDGSPAVDSSIWLALDTEDLDSDGDTDELLPFDQRGNGFPRIQNRLDIGAFEVDQNFLTSEVEQDLNGDGRSNLIWRNLETGQNVVWYMNNTTLVGSKNFPAVPDRNWEISGVGDFNNDNQADLVWRNSATGQNTVWYMNNTTFIGSGAFDSVTEQNWQISGIGDFNNDNQDDLVWRNAATGQNSIWYMNNTNRIGSGNIGSVHPDWTLIA